LGRAEITDCDIEPALHLPISVLRKSDSARLGDRLQTRGDVDAGARKVAVALLHDVAQMNADAELDALLLRDAGVALDHRALDLKGAAHRVNNAAEFNDASVTRALDDAAAVHGDDRVDEVAAERPETSEDPILVRTSETALADNVGHQDRRKFAGLGHAIILPRSAA
jgi:hypothetical protein